MNDTASRHIGLIGGLSPRSTVQYYLHLCNGFNRRRGGLCFPEITLQSINLQRLLELFESHDWDGVAEVLLEALDRLAFAGAEFAAILADAPHHVYDRIRNATPIKIVPVMGGTTDALMRDGRTRVALLGTRPTMELGFFQGHFRENGLETLVPDHTQRIELDRIVWEELSHGIVKPCSREKVAAMIARLGDLGAESVVLGCTELAMLIRPEDSLLPLCDTATLHAEAILQFAVGETFT